jgi:predicted Zn-dependent protease
MAAAALIALSLAGCAPLVDLGTSMGEATGTLTPEQAGSIRRGATAIEKAVAQITPEQEYYIGRSVAATVMASYRPVETRDPNYYLNVLGQTLSLASARPETYGGYHFVLLDSDEINAFSAPGGLIMISRGMLTCCSTEDALAAVLAHEIGHVEGQHGLRAIKKSRLVDALKILTAESAKNLGGQQLAELTTAFGGSIGDVTSTLMSSGYSRELEHEADAAAVRIMKHIGYNPSALVDMLRTMKKGIKPGGLGFAKTHPDPVDRIKDVMPLIGTYTAVSVPESRQDRFQAAMQAAK